MRRVALLASLAALGCAAEFDPQSEVDALRVFGVQKTTPYTKPGDDVTLSMLWHDGTDQAPRDVQVLWISGCFNPPADLFAGCLEDFAGVDFDLDTAFCDPTADVSFCLGNDFTFNMPSGIIDERPPPQDPNQAPYGLSYVFFAVCGGFLGPTKDTGRFAFPLGCYEDQELSKQLGPDDFVAGYSAIYAYDDLVNNNPIVTGFEFNEVEVTPTCIGADCLDAIQAEPAPVDCQAGDVPCVFACPEDGAEECPEFEVKPIIDRASAEPDTISSQLEDKDLQEQMWINYYVDGGEVDSDVRLLNDSITGWNEDFGTKFRAPKKTGPVNIWAVVHDNRGGVDWVRIQVQVN